MGKNNIKAMNIRKATGMKNINPTNYEYLRIVEEINLFFTLHCDSSIRIIERDKCRDGHPQRAARVSPKGEERARTKQQFSVGIVAVLRGNLPSDKLRGKAKQPTLGFN